MTETKGDVGNMLWKNIFSGRSLREGSIESLLQKVPAFSDLSLRELKEVAAIVHHREYRTGEVVFHQGDPGLGMYIIRDGSVSIQIADAEGQGKEIASLDDGDFFGELALLDEAPRSATAVCKTECKLLGFFRPDLFDVIERKPQLGIRIVLKLSEIVVKRLRATDKEISRLRNELEKIKNEQREIGHG